ncbi:hypothetical protein [Azospirillum doebereinerae]
MPTCRFRAAVLAGRRTLEGEHLIDPTASEQYRTEDGWNCLAFHE